MIELVKIGVYIIARNNEKTIKRLLDTISVHLTPRIAILDTGSTDETRTIAAHYGWVGRYVYPPNWKHPFLDDFARARNEAMMLLIEKWDPDWVVWFDTDDIPGVTGLQNLKEAIKAEHENPDIDAIACNYVMFYTEEKGRTVRMSKAKAWRAGKGYWVNRIHELPQIDDYRMAKYEIDFLTLHVGEESGPRNLAIYHDMLEKGEEFTLEQWFDLAREYRQINDYDKVFEYINKYIDGVNALPSLLVGRTRSRQRFLSLAYHYRSTYWFLKNDFKRSREDAFLGIMVDDSVPHNFIQIGWIHANRGLYKRAIPWFMHAYNMPKLGPQYVDFHGTRTYIPVGAIAMCYWKMGNKTRAMKYFGMAMQNDPDKDFLEKHEELYKYWNDMAPNSRAGK